MAKKTAASKKGKTATEKGAKDNTKTVKEKKPKGPLVDEPLKVEDKVVLTVDVKIDDTEIVNLSRKMIAEGDILQTMKDEMKSDAAKHKGRIAEQEKKIADIQSLVKSGTKKEAVQAGKVRDWKNTKVLFVKDGADPNNLKPEDIYKSEPFSEFDYQRKLALEETGEEEGIEGAEDMFKGVGEKTTDEEEQETEEQDVETENADNEETTEDHDLES